MDKDFYNSMMNEIELSPKIAEKVKAQGAAYEQGETTAFKPRRSRPAIIAICAVIVLLTSAFAYGGYMLFADLGVFRLVVSDTEQRIDVFVLINVPLRAGTSVVRGHGSLDEFNCEEQAMIIEHLQGEAFTKNGEAFDFSAWLSGDDYAHKAFEAGLLCSYGRQIARFWLLKRTDGSLSIRLDYWDRVNDVSAVCEVTGKMYYRYIPLRIRYIRAISPDGEDYTYLSNRLANVATEYVVTYCRDEVEAFLGKRLLMPTVLLGRIGEITFSAYTATAGGGIAVQRTMIAQSDTLRIFMQHNYFANEIYDEISGLDLQEPVAGISHFTIAGTRVYSIQDFSACHCCNNNYKAYLWEMDEWIHGVTVLNNEFSDCEVRQIIESMIR